MKTNKFILLLISMFMVLNSCNQDELIKQESNKKGEIDDITFVEGIYKSTTLKRNFPKIKFEKYEKRNLAARSYSSTASYNNIYYEALGRSFKYDPAELDPNNNIRERVIDIDSFSKQGNNKDFIQITPLNQRKGEIKVYDSYEKNEEKDSIVFNNEFNVDFNLFELTFNLGKNKYTETFTNYISEINTSHFGELNISYFKGAPQLLITEGDRASLIEKYLSKPFNMAKYTGSMGRFTSYFAPFILSKYRTGARLQAIVAVSNSQTTQTGNMDKLIKDKIGASLKIKDVGFGFSNESTNTEKNNTIHFKDENKFYSRVITIGGSPTYGINLPTKDAYDNFVDFNEWIKTIDEARYQKIIDILPKGLIPTSAFILEENFRRRFNDIHKGILEKDLEEHKPEINIAKVFVRKSPNGEDLCDVVPMLETRNGDKIMLRAVRYDATDAELQSFSTREGYMAKGREFSKTFKPLFKGLRIHGSPSKVFRPYLRYDLIIEFPFNFNASGNVFKHFNTENKTWYVYDTTNKLAFAYYDLDKVMSGSEGLDEKYGCSEWIKNLPEKEISIFDLMKYYKVIGL